MNTKDAGNNELLVLAPKEMNSLFVPSLVSYGYKVNIINSPEVNLERWKKLDIPDVCVIANATDNADFESLDFLSTITQRMSPSKIVYILCDSASVNKKDKKVDYEKRRKLGIEKVFFYPQERELSLNEIFMLSPLEIPTSKLDLNAMMKVSIRDVDSEESFPFDIFIYLSRNKKILALRRHGAKIEMGLKDKLAKDARYFLLVRRGDYQLYQKQITERLKKVSQDGNLSLAQKTLVVRQEIRTLVHELFAAENLSPEEGQRIVDNFKSVAEEYIESVGGAKDVHDRLRTLTAQIMSNQTHTMNTSAYAAMFGMMYGILDVEALSLAGMLHDIGYYKLPMDVVAAAERGENTISAEQMEVFRKHPELALEVIAERKLPVKESVRKIILQHHERANGSGFPKGLKADEIDEMAKIVAFADVFDEMTSLHADKASCTPREALLRISGRDGAQPHPVYDDAVHRCIVEGLLGEPTSTLPLDIGARETDEAEMKALEARLLKQLGQ